MHIEHTHTYSSHIQNPTLADMQTLVGNQNLSDADLEPILARAHAKAFSPPCSATAPTYCSPSTAPLGDGTYLEPARRLAMRVDHVAQTCVSTAPLEPQLASSLDKVEPLRSAVDEAMRAYVTEHLGDAVLTTYGKLSSAGVAVTACVSRCNLSLANYWSGAWRAEWTLEADGNKASRGRLSGSLECTVHYFEDGNVQLHDSATFGPVELSGELAAEVARQTREWEMGFCSALERIFATMSESLLNGLRRRLPITKVKFDWDNRASVHKLAGDTQQNEQVEAGLGARRPRIVHRRRSSTLCL